MSSKSSAGAAIDDNDDGALSATAEPPLIEILERQLSRRARRRRALVTAFGISALAAAPLAVLRRLKAAEAKPLRRWMCPTDECGYVYDPANGDPERGIPPGTAFEDLPADWVCPNSGTPKERFLPRPD